MSSRNQFEVVMDEEGEVDVLVDDDEEFDVNGFIDAVNDGMITSPGTYEVTETRDKNGSTFKAVPK